MRYVREPVRRMLTSDAALRVISREGIGAATLRRIAKEADVPLSNLNHVYPSKQSLFEDAWERACRLMLALIDSVEKSGPAELEEAVSLLILSLIEGIDPSVERELTEGTGVEDAQRAQYELLLWAVRVPGPEKRSREYRRINSKIENFLESYGVEDIDYAYLAVLIAAISDGLILQILAGQPVGALRGRINILASNLIASCRLGPRGAAAADNASASSAVGENAPSGG
ncbi:TetR/AcrR family transcriptional regulator [Nocardia sp. NPDC058499]|uniref:TetR/AcrR family transcriptional regulator n=1 Tax=Nocardia sp. NPDC058499 TaxID=3346530 RepID=UPI003659EBEB